MVESHRRRGSPSRRASHHLAHAARARNGRRVALVAALAALAALGLIVAGVIGRRQATSAPIQVAAGVHSADRGRGQADAPVTIVEYADLQCPICARFAQDIEPRLAEEFITTGIVRLEYRHFALLGRESARAAEATECAAAQDQFRRYRATLFANQRGENQGGFSDARLTGIAGALAMDTDAFSACLAAGRYADAVKQQTDEGRAQGVRATPTFFVNGVKIEGLVPYNTFRQAIQRARQAAAGNRP